MADIWYDVDTALAEVPVNLMPLIDDTDFKTIEGAVAYNAAGMALRWHFVTTAGAYTVTSVTPTTAGAHDWTDQGDSGVYTMEIPASAGTINNDTEGFGWFTGVATGVLPWRGPVCGFRAAAINDSLIDAGATGLLAPTVAARTLDVSAGGEAGVDWANVGSPTTAVNLSGTNIDPDQVVASVTGAVGSVTGAVGSVTGAVGSVTGAVGSVTGNVGGNVVGSVASVTGAVGSVTGAVGSVTGNVGGNVTGTVGMVNALAANVITAAATAADFTTEIQTGLATAANLATVAGYLDTEMAATLAAAQDIQTRLPAALVSGRMDASVGAAAANTLTASALATDAVTEIVTALLTTVMTESYAADGAAPTLTQALLLVQQILTELTISGTTGTVKKLDGATTAATLTYNDATTPTSVTRAT